MQPEAIETALEPDSTVDRSMLVLQYVIAVLAVTAAGLLALVH